MPRTLHQQLPLIAILRGLPPEQAVAVAGALAGAGFRMLEVPLNSPQPLRSIDLLAKSFGDSCLIGAGTVTRVEQVEAVSRAGGRLIVSPNTDSAVIAESKRLQMVSLPGCCSPTEAFAALQAGADALKLFPSEQIPAAAVRALTAVLPAATTLYAVGGIDAGKIPDYLRAGVSGFGIGSAIYRPGKTPAQIAADATALIEAYRRAAQQHDFLPRT